MGSTSFELKTHDDFKPLNIQVRVYDDQVILTQDKDKIQIQPEQWLEIRKRMLYKIIVNQREIESLQDTI